MKKEIKNFEKWMTRQSGISNESFITSVLNNNEPLVENMEDKPLENPEEYDIILLGNIGLAGSAYIGNTYGDKLKKVFPEWFVNKAVKLYSVEFDFYRLQQLLLEKDASVICTIPVLEGGMYRALYQLWKKLECGFEVDYGLVAVSQITIELCEYYDLDPWGLLSGKCHIIVAEHGHKLARKLSTEFDGVQVVGRLLKSKDKLIIHRENISRVNRPPADGLLQLLQRE